MTLGGNGLRSGVANRLGLVVRHCPPLHPRPYAVAVAVALALCAVAATGLGAEPRPARANQVVNGDFETAEGTTVAQAIPGWTTYGSPKTAIEVCSDGGDDACALKISRGKAFCYGLPLDPAVDYTLKVRVKAENAHVSIETPAAEPGRWSPGNDRTTFDWQTFELPLPAATRRTAGQETWLALGGQANGPGGSAWFDDVRLQPAERHPDPVPNGSFSAPVLEVCNLPGWQQEAGGADAALDEVERKEGRSSLRVTGRGRPARIVQTMDVSGFVGRGFHRVRIAAWGRCAGLTAETVKFVVAGTRTPLPPVLCMTGDQAWTPGHVIVHLDDIPNRSLRLCVESKRPFTGQAWFDAVQVQPVPDDETANLLWNSGFHLACTNPRLPDHWGPFGNATICVEPWSLDFFRIDEDVRSPVPETRVLRVHHPPRSHFVPVPPADRISYFVVHGGELSLESTPFTFSVYAKAARPGTQVCLQHPATTQGTSFTVDTNWQRISVTGTTPRLLASVYLPNPDSLVWIAAPQLEAGKTPTAYRPSQGPGRPDPGPPPIPTHRPQPPLPAQDRQPAELPPKPPAILEAFVEYDIYQADSQVRGRVRWTGTTPVEIHGRLIDTASGTVVIPKLFTLPMDPGGLKGFAFEAGKNPAGRFALQAVALNDGRKVARATDIFSIARNAHRGVRSSRFTRSLIVDGKPFFPLFMPLNPADLGDWHLRRLATAGFNTLIAAPGHLDYATLARHGFPPTYEADVRRQLDRLTANNLRFVWPLAWTFGDWERGTAESHGHIEALSKALQLIVRRFRDHPAIIGWYLVDEPSQLNWEQQYGFKEADLASLHDVVKAEDPLRPCYVNWNHTWNFQPYGGQACTDLIGHDNYETSDAPFDLESLTPSVRMINDERAARKPAIAWISGSYDETNLRPSADAIRVHAWLHVVHGTRGLGYWSKPPIDPAAWDSMQEINHEVSRLHAHVFGREDARLAVLNFEKNGVHYVVWSIPRRAYVIGVNTKATAAPIRLELESQLRAPPTSIRRLFPAEKTYRPFDGVLSETVPGRERFVYELELSDDRGD